MSADAVLTILVACVVLGLAFAAVGVLMVWIEAVRPR